MASEDSSTVSHRHEASQYKTPGRVAEARGCCTSGSCRLGEDFELRQKFQTCTREVGRGAEQHELAAALQGALGGMFGEL